MDAAPGLPARELCTDPRRTILCMWLSSTETAPAPNTGNKCTELSPEPKHHLLTSKWFTSRTVNDEGFISQETFTQKGN